MKIKDALKETHAHYYVVQVSVKSPDKDRVTYSRTKDPEVTDWRAEVGYSDGQYGGGTKPGRGPTMEAAIDDALRQFHAEIEKLYPRYS